ncbi:hypothetical protein SXIM_12180 [Streptomyces xiamenensis]|uniref:Uncharacterized protein n=2 Tax=Streptomyces TaxID=1883 RepID=A0A0F7FR26_9ACTN|nr:hypothetical protein SXIM_12180 [Streptomyces xiamenensis]
MMGVGGPRTHLSRKQLRGGRGGAGAGGAGQDAAAQKRELLRRLRERRDA